MADSAYDAAVLADSPAFFNQLSESSLAAGATIASRVGLRPGVVVGSGLTPVTGPSAAVGNGIQWPGTDGTYIDLGQGRLIDPDANETVECWLKLPAGQAWGGILGRSLADSSLPFPAVRQDSGGSGGTVQFVMPSGDISPPVTNPVQVNWDADTWYHFALVGSGSTYSVYLNGQLVGQTGRPSTSRHDDAGLVKVIGTVGATFMPYAGALTRLAVYHLALSQAQVQAHYAAGLGPPASSAFDDAVTALNPVHYWPLSESAAGAGAIIGDSVGGRTGTVAGAGVSVVAGPTDAMPTALHFDGSTDAYLTLGSAALFAGLESATIGLWLKPDVTGPTTRGVFVTNIGPGSNYGPSLLWESGSIYWRFAGTGVQDASPAPADTWAFVVVTHSPSGDQAYINGQPAGALQGSGNALDDDAGEVKEIGRLQLSGRYFTGAVSRVFVFTRALTAAEILDLWDNRADVAEPGGTIDERDALERIGSSTVYPDGTKDTLFTLLYRLTGQLELLNLGDPPAAGTVAAVPGSVGKLWRYEDGSSDTLASLLYALIGVEAPDAED